VEMKQEEFEDWLEIGEKTGSMLVIRGGFII
jgi:hypothetical protein